MDWKKVDCFIDEHQEELLEDVKTLVRIDSKRGAAAEGKPYGEGPAQVLAAAEKIMQKYGLHTHNYENYVLTGDLNEKERQLDILAHLDVVPVTDDWTVTKPFEPLVVDGRIYGRGTVDDKGPAVAALYAMRAIKECGIELKKNVRLILGADEECGSSDLTYYYEREKEAPMSFTPDGDFPLINVEKGRFAPHFEAKFAPDAKELPRLVKLDGGDKANVVPANAWALTEGIEAQLVKETAAKLENGIAYTVTEEDGKVRIAAKGAAGHGSTPEMGNNAISGLLELLELLPLAESEGWRTIRALHALFPRTDYCGEALGVAMEDEVSGKLSMNFAILRYDGTSLYGEFDSRVPICGNQENVADVIARKFAEAGVQIGEEKMVAPHYVPEEAELVQTLLGCYEKYSGKKEKPLAIGGGTYVHRLENGVAFGCAFPDIDNHMHGDDEFIDISVLMMSTKIFADAILKLCGVEEA